MDHHEAVRKFEHLMLKEADHAREIATELEALAPILTTENSRQLAQLQIKASQASQRVSRIVGEGQREIVLDAAPVLVYCWVPVGECFDEVLLEINFSARVSPCQIRYLAAAAIAASNVTIHST
jgi:hypothetical protein